MGRQKDDKKNDKKKGENTADLARKKVGSFVKKLTFNNLVASGYSIEDAARKIGVNVRPGERLKPQDYLDLKSKGEIGKRKRHGF